jgi:hypothetical protein
MRQGNQGKRKEPGALAKARQVLADGIAEVMVRHRIRITTTVLERIDEEVRAAAAGESDRI